MRRSYCGGRHRLPGRARLVLPVLMVAAAAPALAQERTDSGAFIVRLGRDTVAMERYVRSGDTLRATIVTRSPSTAVRHYMATFGADGGIRAFATARDGQPLEPRAVPAGAIPLAGQFYVPFQLAVQRALGADADSVNVTLLTGQEPLPVVVRRVAARTFVLPNQFGVPMRVSADARGRIASVDAGGGSSVERLAWFDLEGTIRGFRARDAAGTGLGPLSPLDSSAVAIHAARIRVEYSRPALRGRALGMLVPDGQVWRTGANNATHMTTDRELRFGNVSVPAGTYTLFTLPSASGWTLIVNRQTGQGGLDYDAAQDHARIEMTVERNAPHSERFTIDIEPFAQGGVLRLRWGAVRASAPFNVAGAP